MPCRAQLFPVISAALVALISVASHAAELETVTIGFVGDADSAAARGAQLGVEEAGRQARYFGFVFALETEAPKQPIVISAQREPDALESLLGPGRLVLNALDPARGVCDRGLFHIAASEAMIESARAQWRAEQGGETPRVAAWHPSLVKYAARDLNKRFRERFGVPMEGEAWNGWAAARSIGEAVLRTRSEEPAAVGAYFLGDFGFDGQKGSQLTFRSIRQLWHPLYYVSEDDRVLGEASLGDDPGETPDTGGADHHGCPPADTTS